MQLVVLILAAGSSSRMGSIKQLLSINEKTLLQHTLDLSIKIKSTKTLCILGAHAEEIMQKVEGKKIEFVINRNHKLGLSSSIIRGIEHLQEKKTSFDGLFILLADQPAIKIDYYDEMMRLFLKNKKKIIASTYENGPGVPAIFPAVFTKDLLQITGDKGAKEFLQKNKNKTLSPQTPVNLLDIDTPKDYKHFIGTL
ncbi:MAG: nucleotidyltransferase family protein [Polaribacter sp.]|nr:nucleotidyltransferase family protein [Polaribacter sp.]